MCAGGLSRRADGIGESAEVFHQGSRIRRVDLGIYGVTWQNAELRREALARPRRTWDEYARDLWSALVAPDGGPHTDDRSPVLASIDQRPTERAR